MRAASIARRVGRAFNAGRVLGALVFIVSSDEAPRETALVEGGAYLRGGSLSHSYLWFYRFAIDDMLQINDWDRAEHYAASLEEYTRAGPLPRADFFSAPVKP